MSKRCACHQGSKCAYCYLRGSARRRSLRDEYRRIFRVQMESTYLVEELRRRRDGEQPSYIDLEYLRQAVEEVRDVRV